MPIPRFDYTERPFYQPRYTPDTSRLASIVSRGGEQLAQLALQSGQSKADLAARLSSILSGGLETMRAQKATATAQAIRSKEREDERQEREQERKSRAEERKADKASEKSRERRAHSARRESR